jgi:hypothetical protein
MLKRIKDRGKKLKEKVLSINRSALPNPQSANISTSAGLQGSNDLALIPQTDQASGTATPTVPDHSKPRLAKPDKTSLTQVDEQQQLAEATVRVLSLQNWHEINHHLQPVTIYPGYIFHTHTS